MKHGRDHTGWRSLRHWLTGLMAGCTSLPALAGPHGMSVQQGSASATRNGSTTDITASHNAVINWSSFNIGAGETVNFHQPNAVSVVWNRIFDANPTQIWGNLNANGWVVLMNQNGFFFGPNSSINVGGFMATTTPVAPPPSAGGGMWQFNGTPPLASIINYGQVKANNGGGIFMVAEKVENHGVLSAPDGTLALYAGKEVLVSDRPDGRGLSARVNLPSGSVDNDGQLIADAGTIALHAKVVNNNGLAQANSVRERNGHIEFVATDSVNLGAHSDLQARGGGEDASDGGQIKIQSAGTFADQAGSRIDVSGGTQGGNGGSVELSALSMATPKSTLDGHAQAGWRGGSLLFDPYDITLTSAEDASGDPSGTIHADDSPGSSLRLNVNTAFGGFSDIHLQALHDISLELGTVWDLNQSTGISDAGSRLTLEAGNNIVFGDNARITSAGGWSVRLAAGVDFNSLTLASIPGTGNIYLNGGAPDINGAKPNGGGAVEVAEGSISMAAGHDITVGSGYIRTTAGGSIHLTTGDGDVDAGTKNDTYDFPSRFPYQISARGLGGIGTAAGGDVRIEAGRDILAFNASIGAFADGNVFLGAGRDIKGRFMLRHGIGNLEAGQDIGSSSSPISLGLVSGGWSATATRDLYLNEIYNPNGSQNSSRVGGVAYRFDYAPDSYARLAAGNSVQLLGNAPIHDNSNGNADRPVIYAPKLDIDAGAGGVVLGNDIILFPSPLGSLHIRTTDGGALRSVPGGLYQLIVSDSGSLDYRTFAQGHAVGRPLHLDSGDAGINLEIAGDVQNLFLRVPRQADISIGGNVRNFSFEGQNLSANDVTSIHVLGSWFSRSDRTFAISTIQPVPSGVVLSLPLIHGQLDPLGIFNDPLAAVSPDLGARLTYDPVTHRLGFQGIMTSQERDFLLHPMIYELDPVTRLRRVDSTGNFVVVPVSSPLDAAAVQSLYADSQDVPTSPLARNGLQLGGPGRFDISAHDLDLGISAGIRSVGLLLNPALAAVSPAGADIKLDLGGNLDMTSSQIASFSGGNIDLTALGHLNIGSQDQFTSDDTPKGIYTGHGGNVTVKAGEDINLSGSRIASYDGGNISVISEHGTVDAGEGARGFFTVTTSQIDPVTGEVVTRNDRFFGSGIIALTRSDSDAHVGDIEVRAALDIAANSGGVLQLAFNKVDQSAAKVVLDAGRDIKANQSGILGGNVDVNAGGKIEGTIVAGHDLSVTAVQSVNVIALSGGQASVSGATVSGSVVAAGNATVAGTSDASVISTGGSASGGASSSSGNSAFAGVAAPVAAKTTEDADKTLAKAATTSDEESDDAKKKKAGPVLAKNAGRVTVILPKN